MSTTRKIVLIVCSAVATVFVACGVLTYVVIDSGLVADGMSSLAGRDNLGRAKVGDCLNDVARSADRPRFLDCDNRSAIYQVIDIQPDLTWGESDDACQVAGTSFKYFWISDPFVTAVVDSTEGTFICLQKTPLR